MNDEQYVKGQLATFCWRECPLTGGSEEMTAIAMVLRNRVRRGWENSTWLGVIEGAVARRGASHADPPRCGYPDMRDPHWCKFFARLDGIYDFSLNDTWTTASASIAPGRRPLGEQHVNLTERSGLFWAEMSRPGLSAEFLTRVARDHVNHPPCATVGTLRIFS